MVNNQDKENLSPKSNNKPTNSYQASKGSTNDDNPNNINFPSLIAGRYTIEKELGRGGVGVVYLAKDKQVLSKRVVIKVLLDEKVEDEWVKVKFRQEMEALSRIDHPGVISILDIGQLPDSRSYFVMPFIEGISLRSAIKTEGMPLKDVASIIEQLGSALKATHDKGVFHRDLKPENIMLQITDNEQRVKIIDFGVAKVKNPQEGQSTQVEKLAGTFFYMSPEQLMGIPISAASDIFSLAVVAYEMITGRRPFFSENTGPSTLLLELVAQHQSGPRIKPKDLRPSISEQAQEIILKGLNYSVKKRYQNADEFGKELSVALKINIPKLPLKIRNPKEFESSAEVNVSSSESLQNFVQDLPSKEIKKNLPTNPSSSQQPQNKTIKNKQNTILIISMVGIIIVLSILLLSKSLNQQSVINKTETNIEKGITLTYWVIVQRYRDGKPYKEPYRLAQEIAFQEGDCVKLFFVSPQKGYIYILNEGPPNKDGSLPSWNTLFPTPFNNNGLSELATNNPLEISGSGEGFCFDKQEGTEKIWLIFSLEKITLLEDLKKWVNEKDKSEIRDSNQMATVREFIQNNSSKRPTIQKDDAQKQTIITSSNKLIVTALVLTHI